MSVPEWAEEGSSEIDNGGDANGDGVLEDCECTGDITLDGLVGVEDLLAIIATWGNTGGSEDIDGSGMVGTGDLLIILDDWGWCE